MPNHFTSMFNSNSYALSLEEAKIFRENKIIAQNLIKSYEIMSDFFGIKLENHEFSKNKNYSTRISGTLAVPTHNHLRMRRFLAHLNVVGFRTYAIKLVDFFMKETGKGKSLYNVRETVQKNWAKYGRIDEKNIKEIEILIKNCYPAECLSNIEELYTYIQEASIIFQK